MIRKVDDKNIRIDVNEVFSGGKPAARPGIQRPDQLTGRIDLFLRGPEGLGDEAVSILAEGVQMVLGDPDCQSAVLSAFELEHQTFREGPRPHPRRFQALNDLQRPCRQNQGLLHLYRQVLQRLVQPAVLIQGLH